MGQLCYIIWLYKNLYNDISSVAGHGIAVAHAAPVLRPAIAHAAAPVEVYVRIFLWQEMVIFVTNDTRYLAECVEILSTTNEYRPVQRNFKGN